MGAASLPLAPERRCSVLLPQALIKPFGIEHPAAITFGSILCYWQRIESGLIDPWLVPRERVEESIVQNFANG